MKKFFILISLIVTVNCDSDTETLKLVEKYDLLELGRNITLKVLDPDKIPQPHRLPQTPAQTFIQDIFRYKNRLSAVYIMLSGGNNEGHKIFQYLYDHGGPPHLSLHFDYHHLTIYYYLKENEVLNIKDLLDSTKQLWLRMCKTMNKRKTITKNLKT